MRTESVANKGVSMSASRQAPVRCGIRLNLREGEEAVGEHTDGCCR